MLLFLSFHLTVQAWRCSAVDMLIYKQRIRALTLWNFKHKEYDKFNLKFNLNQ